MGKAEAGQLRKQIGSHIMDRKNPVSVYDSSGDPYTTGWLANPTGRTSYASAEARSLFRMYLVSVLDTATGRERPQDATRSRTSEGVGSSRSFKLPLVDIGTSLRWLAS